MPAASRSPSQVEARRSKISEYCTTSLNELPRESQDAHLSLVHASGRQEDGEAFEVGQKTSGRIMPFESRRKVTKHQGADQQGEV